MADTDNTAEAPAEPDGWMVISSKATGAKPPYVRQYMHDFFTYLDMASTRYLDLENGEMGEWRPFALVPCVKGMPQPDRKLGPVEIARVVQESCGSVAVGFAPQFYDRTDR